MAGFTLVEVIGYLAALIILLGVAFGIWRQMSVHAARIAAHAGRVAAAVAAGELWRSDVRAASAAPTATGSAMEIPAPGGTIRYLLDEGRVRREAPGGNARNLLDQAVDSRMIRDENAGVVAYRWELALRGARDPEKTLAFSFLAVPGSSAGGMP